jgi:hypothetical protein
VVVWIQCFNFGLRGGRQNKVLLEDEADAVSSSWLNAKEV